MDDLMLQQCRLAGYESARDELKEWMDLFAHQLDHMKETELTPQRVATEGALDFLKDVAAQLNLSSCEYHESKPQR